MDELQKLCDEVPEFSNEKAYQIFKDELGIDANDIFEFITVNPIAAASVG
jgi:predicted unusual protein kinase regulating ubiquinone biosynthesis (AarF/ABC1/UbiB family)